MDDDTARKELLLKLYDQLYHDIDRHIIVIWQSITVIVGAFTAIALIERQVIPIDMATTLFLLLCGWLFAHLLDTSYWYNRNLVMIANIDRQFLRDNDLKEIHYYFGAHRPKNRMIMHLKIQFALGIGLAGLMLLYHFFVRVVPDFGLKENIDLIRILPYLVMVVLVGFLIWLWHNRTKSYQEFLENSPGKPIDSKGVKYGVGHGFRSCDKVP